MALVALAVAAQPAFAGEAEDKENVRELFTEATKRYNLGQFDRALPLYTRAYEVRPDPAFLFNIAQCDRQLGKWSDAAREYRAYLREAPDAPHRDEIERHIADMDKAAAEERAAKSPTGVQAPATPAPATAPTEGRASRTGVVVGIGVAAGVVVIAAVILGIVFGAQQHPGAPMTTLGNFGVF